MDTTQKFTGRAGIYSHCRPAYPEPMLDWLAARCPPSPSAPVADVGAGTGILTRQLLERGFTVHAVEPNPDMRREAEQALHGFSSFLSRDGTAEQTGLPPQSVGLVTAAQAFHWFDPDAFRRECSRILKPGGFVALVWNSRNGDSPLVRESSLLCRKWCPDFNGFSGGIGSKPDAVSAFFSGGSFEFRRFANPVRYDREGFVGRNLSSSYAPKPGEADYLPFAEALGALFDRYADSGVLLFDYHTDCWLGTLS